MILFQATLPYFFLSLFHLVLCTTNHERATNLTKIVLMPSLICGLFIIKIAGRLSEIDTGNSNLNILTIYYFIIIALIAGTLGDFFLIQPKTRKNFYFGTFFFFLGHIFYIILIASRFDYNFIPKWINICFIIIYFIICLLQLIIFRGIGVSKKIVIVIYAATLLVMNYFCFSPFIFLLLNGQSFSSLPHQYYFSALGNLFFLISDGILSFTLFKKDFKQSRVVIMATYIIAQFFLVWGLL